MVLDQQQNAPHDISIIHTFIVEAAEQALGHEDEYRRQSPKKRKDADCIAHPFKVLPQRMGLIEVQRVNHGIECTPTEEDGACAPNQPRSDFNTGVMEGICQPPNDDEKCDKDTQYNDELNDGQLPLNLRQLVPTPDHSAFKSHGREDGPKGHEHETDNKHLAAHVLCMEQLRGMSGHRDNEGG